MRLRNIPGARERVASSAYCIRDASAYRGRWREVFPGAEALMLEIGAGKGRFLTGLARLHPGCAFLGMERYATVIDKALKKLEAEGLDNLRYLPMDAVLIEGVFDAGELDRIYLNFSDPWPKKRHAGRRLTGADFLRRYDKVLSREGTIEFKTDNRTLFDWSVEEAASQGWEILQLTHDLHADAEMCKDNVMTEYEERFSSMGHPICKYIIRR